MTLTSTRTPSVAAQLAYNLWRVKCCTLSQFSEWYDGDGAVGLGPPNRYEFCHDCSETWRTLMFAEGRCRKRRVVSLTESTRNPVILSLDSFVDLPYYDLAVRRYRDRLSINAIAREHKLSWSAVESRLSKFFEAAHARQRQARTAPQPPPRMSVVSPVQARRRDTSREETHTVPRRLQLRDLFTLQVETRSTSNGV